MSTGLKANVDGSAAIQVGGVDAITLTSAGAASFVTSPMTIQGGSASAPSLTFSGDTNTGIFSPAADTIAFTEGGVEAMRLDSSGNLGVGTSSPAQRLQVNNPAASSSLALFTNATTGSTNADGSFYGVDSSGNAYVWNQENLPILFGTNNGERMRIDNAGNVGIGTSSPGVRLDVAGNARVGNAGGTFQGLTLQNNNNSASAETISFLDTANNLGTIDANLFFGHQTDGGSYVTFGTTPAGSRSSDRRVERARINSSGNMQIGGTSDNGRLTVDGSTADNTANSLTVRNSAGTILFQARNNGEFYTGVAASSPYNSTTGSAANAFIAASGILQRSTSSIKYKRDVEDATHGLAEVMQLRPVTYKGKSETDGDTVFGGLIAEEVHEAGLIEFVQYAEDGTPDALAYGNMVSLCIKAVQELKAELDATKAEVALLKGAA